MAESTHGEVSTSASALDFRTRRLIVSARAQAPADAATLLEPEHDATIAQVIERLPAGQAVRVLELLPESRRVTVLASGAGRLAEQWSVNATYAPESVGRFMEPPSGLFRAEDSVAAVVEQLRESIVQYPITYVHVVDEEQRLVGLTTMRDLLFAGPEDRLEDVMLRRPFALRADDTRSAASEAAQRRHYPTYPVCDAGGRLIGIVHGYVLSEHRELEAVAQPGKMVGVEREERLATPWKRSLRHRHPWLQFNLFTAFIAAAVVGLFEGTIAQIVALAAFLPVLAGQSGNTGCQSLAVTLRGITLNEYQPGGAFALIRKEAVLGLCNGALVGVTAALGMLLYATISGSAGAMALAAVVFLAMTIACVASGVSGVIVPLVLRRLGADPVTASTIILTTATDVVSMGTLLGLATWLVL